MPQEQAKKIFEDYLSAKGLKHSEQRLAVLDLFLKNERHITAEELYRQAKKGLPSIGFATIYRTLKLLCECGVCRELHFADGTSRYEHLWGHAHHDHLICLKCGRFIEAISPEIETLQEKLAAEKGFKLLSHRLELYGTCKKCNGNR